MRMTADSKASGMKKRHVTAFNLAAAEKNKDRTFTFTQNCCKIHYQREFFFGSHKKVFISCVCKKRSFVICGGANFE